MTFGGITTPLDRRQLKDDQPVLPAHCHPVAPSCWLAPAAQCDGHQRQGGPVRSGGASAALPAGHPAGTGGWVGGGWMGGCAMDPAAVAQALAELLLTAVTVTPLPRFAAAAPRRYCQPRRSARHCMGPANQGLPAYPATAVCLLPACRKSTRVQDLWRHLYRLLPSLPYLPACLLSACLPACLQEIATRVQGLWRHYARAEVLAADWDGLLLRVRQLPPWAGMVVFP